MLSSGLALWEAERRGPDLRAPGLTLSDRAEILLEGLGWHFARAVFPDVVFRGWQESRKA